MQKVYKSGKPHEDIVRIHKHIAERDKDAAIFESRDLMVVKANALIQKSRFSLSLQEQRIILYIISKIKPDDKELNAISISYKEFCSVCGIDISAGGFYYNEIKTVIKSLADKSIWIKKDNDTEVLVRWIEKPTINKTDGIKIKLDDDLMPYLIELKNHYTQYALINILCCKSKYGIRLYELLKSYANLRSIKFSIEELKEKLGAETYTNFTNFKTKVLIPALSDIELYTDIKVSVIYEKKGRQFTKIEFIITDIRGTEEYYQKYDKYIGELDK